MSGGQAAWSSAISIAAGRPPSSRISSGTTWARRSRVGFDDRQQWYLGRIRGRTNDARLATNHACLAAAFELFAGFMGDAWGEADASEAARAFAEEYIAGLVVEAAGDVDSETPARIFLGTLGELHEFGQVRIEGIGPHIGSNDPREQDRVVGRLANLSQQFPSGLNPSADDRIIQLSIKLSLGHVNHHLRREGRTELKISPRTLLEQLASMGLLLDPNDQPIAKGKPGEMTKKARRRGFDQCGADPG